MTSINVFVFITRVRNALLRKLNSHNHTRGGTHLLSMRNHGHYEARAATAHTMYKAGFPWRY